CIVNMSKVIDNSPFCPNLLIHIFVFAKKNKAMIKKVLFTLLLATPALFCLAQQAPASIPAPAVIDPNLPVMNFDNKEHDYGTIMQDDNGTYLFFFTNTGKE